MSLLRIVGKAFSHLTSYESRQAIDTIEWLSARHKRSSWVLSLMAKAYFELAEYKQATRLVRFFIFFLTKGGKVDRFIFNLLRLFQEVREMEPYRTDLMEYYSTALWHLQQEVSLSALAQDMLEQDKMSAATWCCAGNCLDLQKDREQALKFFQRAIQVDPKFAYAYTLLGHQYLALEETEKAMDCFKNAVRVDPIHYNGW
jgi:anaphase-promoting complex subunit 3